MVGKLLQPADQQGVSILFEAAVGVEIEALDIISQPTCLNRVEHDLD